jgi:hypothetical protein
MSWRHIMASNSLPFPAMTHRHGASQPHVTREAPGMAGRARPGREVATRERHGHYAAEHEVRALRRLAVGPIHGDGSDRAVERPTMGWPVRSDRSRKPFFQSSSVLRTSFRYGENAQFLSRREERSISFENKNGPARLSAAVRPPGYSRTGACAADAGGAAHTCAARTRAARTRGTWCGASARQYTTILLRVTLATAAVNIRLLAAGGARTSQGGLPGSRDGRGRADGWQAPVEDDAWGSSLRTMCPPLRAWAMGLMGLLSRPAAHRS